MAYLHCDTVPDVFNTETASPDSILEVYLWEAFLLRRNGRVAEFLLNHSIDNGPLITGEIPLWRTCYRFSYTEWSGHVKHFLIDNKVPVTVRALHEKVLQGNDR